MRNPWKDVSFFWLFFNWFLDSFWEGFGKRFGPQNLWKKHRKPDETNYDFFMVFGAKMTPKWEARGIPKSRRFVDISWPCPRDPSGEANGAKMKPKWSQNGAKTEPKWSQNEFKMSSKWCQNDFKLKAPKLSQNEPKIVQNQSES